MDVLFFSLVVWLLMLALTAADGEFLKVCKYPRSKWINKRKHITLKDFQNYDSCKRNNEKYMRNQIEQLNEELLNATSNNRSDYDYYGSEDYVKCRSELLNCENKISDYNHETINCVTAECRTGFHYDKDHCQQNICRCQNGEASTGTDCEVHEHNSCEIGSCKKGFYMTDESKKSANPECIKDLFKGKDYTAVGSTGVYFLYEPEYMYSLAQAHQFCQDLGANLGTIRDHTELKVFKSIVTNHCWIDVSSPKPSANRSDWIWGNNGGQVSTDDDFWHPGSPSLNGSAGNKGGWRLGKGISNFMYGVDDKWGALCEIRTNQ